MYLGLYSIQGNVYNSCIVRGSGCIGGCIQFRVIYSTVVDVWGSGGVGDYIQSRVMYATVVDVGVVMLLGNRLYSIQGNVYNSCRCRG